MRLQQGLFLILFSPVICASSVLARELIVDQRHASASDSNPGTAAQPLKSISAAVAKVQPGDHVIVHGGEYREVVQLRNSGTAEHPIVLEAAPGEVPVIKGSDIVRNWTRENGAIWKAPIRDPGSPGPPDGPGFSNTNDVRQVFVQDGVLFDAQRLRRVRERGQLREGTFYCDRATSSLYVWLPGSASPLDDPPEVAVRGSLLAVTGDHIIIRGLQMRHASTTAIANAPASVLQGHHNLMEKCSITWGDFVGISISGTDNCLRGSLIACNGDSGIGGTGERNTIEGCRVVYNNVDRYSPEWHAGGAKLIPNFRDGTIRHNEFAHNMGTGLWLDGACDHNVIDGNISHDNEGPGIMVEISVANLVINNLSYSNRNHLSGPWRDEKGVVFEQNSSEKRIAPSRFLKAYDSGDGRGIYVSSAPQTKILHNTVYLNEAEGICVEGPIRKGLPTDYRTHDYVVANNISVFNQGSQLTIRGVEGSETIPHFSDHNLLFAVGAVLAKYGWESPPTLTMADWQKASGQDAHSIDADPRFAMPAMDDYRLLPKSSALRAGRFFTEADHDFFGRTRDHEHPSIGACEDATQNYPVPLWQRLSKTIRARIR